MRRKFVRVVRGRDGLEGDYPLEFLPGGHAGFLAEGVHVDVAVAQVELQAFDRRSIADKFVAVEKYQSFIFELEIGYS